MSKDKEMPEKADLQSLDISAENRAKLKQLFPSVFTETKDEKGELVESLDFEKLKAELGTFSDVFESRRERYGMDWPGKKDCMKLIQKPSIATLKPCREESVNFDDTENLFIEGDNLEVLKLLQKSYYGKIKMIYIDPPYNTGNEFVYPDDYSESLDTYLAYAGLIDDEGKKFSTNTPHEGRFHSKWLNMMYSRLYLARNLLTEDGVIFISIDDNEVSNLRKVCDEFFGEENFAAQFVWKSKAGGDARAVTGVSTDHEYILAYFKSTIFPFTGVEKDTAKFSNPDNDPRGMWRSADMTGLATKDARPNLHYDLVDPDTGINYGCPPLGWAYSQETMRKKISEKRILWPKNSEGRPRHKLFLEEIGTFKAAPSIITDFTTGDGTKEIKTLFGERMFNFPKTVKLLTLLINQVCNDGDIILDLFAGSCTTAHAVLDMNFQEDKNYKFIMVQLPEPCDEKSEALKAGFENISDVGKERIRRVITNLEKNQKERHRKAKSDLLKSKDPEQKLDLGFKVLKLDKSNFDVWDGAEPEPTDEKIAKQLEAFVEHIDPKATQEDVLFELLLKAGFKPTEKIEKKEFAGKTVFSIAEGLLLICLEDEITKELIEAVAEAEPLQFICLDRGFKGNDQLKANAVQTFAARNQGRDKQDQIVFRTV